MRVALGAQRDGVLLRSIRQQHGLSQECVGKMAGRSRSWTNQIEQGTMRPSPDALAKLGRKVDARLTQQAARRLNISVKIMRRLVWANEISYIDTNRGGRYIKARFTEEHLSEYLERNEVKAG